MRRGGEIMCKSAGGICELFSRGCGGRWAWGACGVEVVVISDGDRPEVGVG